MNKEPLVWYELSLLNGVDIPPPGSSYYKPRYCRFYGIVFVKGTIRTNTIDSSIVFGILPEGFRPSNIIGPVKVVATAGAYDQPLAYIHIDAAGGCLISSQSTKLNHEIGYDFLISYPDKGSY